jgi:hypothetical protein
VSKKRIGGIFLSIFFTSMVAVAIVPDIPISIAPSSCTLRIKNNTQLDQPITFGTVNQSAASYNTVSLPNGAWGSLSVDCDTLLNMSQRPNANQVLSRNSQTTYIMDLPAVNQAQAPKMPPISRLVLGVGAKSQIFVTSPNPVCVLPASMCQ